MENQPDIYFVCVSVCVRQRLMGSLIIPNQTFTQSLLHVCELGEVCTYQLIKHMLRAELKY